MNEPLFNDRRRQQFLSEDYYEKTLSYWQDDLQAELAGNIERESNEYNCAEVEQWHAISGSRFFLLCLEYTAGALIEELRQMLEDAVEANEIEQKHGATYFKNSDYFVQGGTGEGYVEALWYLSLAYLLHRRDLLPRIEKLIYGQNGTAQPKDMVFEDLLRFNNPMQPEAENYHDGRYGKLMDALYKESSKEVALEDLNSYLKEWYKIHKRHIWHDSHTRDDEYGYCGYWAFEAAAVAYLLELDDSCLHKYLYYPKDLVEYARSKPVDSSPQSKPPQAIEPPPSRYTGYSVAVGEVCQETGYYECPRLQGRTVMLMQGQPVAGEKFNEMGTIIWYKLTKEAEREYLENRKKNPITGEWL